MPELAASPSPSSPGKRAGKAISTALLGGCLLAASHGLPVQGIEAWRVVVRDVGRVESLQVGQVSWSPIWRSRVLTDGDQARTLEASRARILLADQSEFTIGASSVVAMTKFELSPEGRTVLFNLQVGKVRARVARAFGRKSRFEVTTPNGVLAARGTEFYVEIFPRSATSQLPLLWASAGSSDIEHGLLAEATSSAGSTFVKVLSGHVSASTSGGTTMLPPGQTALLGARGEIQVGAPYPGAPGPRGVPSGEGLEQPAQGGTSDADLREPSGADHEAPPAGGSSGGGTQSSHAPPNSYETQRPPDGAATTPYNAPPTGASTGANQATSLGTVRIQIRTQTTPGR